MKCKRTYILSSLSTVAMAYMMPLTAFASSTGSAVRDILVDERFEGAMSSITWLTEMVDNWFIKIITITAFFIISMSLLKNVLAAAYCAFPVFFNKVHEAHEQMKWSEMSMGGFKEVGSKLKDGKISDVILSIIPDFKALTDFADQEMSPKTYFMKAIPQMCIMVIIGIFIYNGYYRDVSATVGEAGATIIENVLGSVSPEKAVNDIFNMKTDPKNTYRNDKTIEGGFIKELSNNMYKQIKNYSTVYKASAENKEALMRCCELTAYNMVKGNLVPDGWAGEGSPFKGTDQYDLKLSNVTVSLASTKTGGYCNTDTSDGSRAFRYEIDLTTILNTNVAGSEEELQGKFIVVTGNLNPTAKSKKTFATTIQAVSGDLSQATAGFSSIEITLTQAQVAASGASLNSDGCSFQISKFSTDVQAAISAQLAANGGGVISADSLKFHGTNANEYVTVSQGVKTKACTVSFQYTEPTTDANGAAVESVPKDASVDVFVTIN